MKKILLIEDDEDIRILEAMGLTPEQIRQSLER